MVSARQTRNPGETYKPSQHALSDRIRECTVLLQHFVEAIAPSYGPTIHVVSRADSPRMDIFDSDAYFGRQFPFKVKHNSMLRLAVAAVSAKHITGMKDDQLQDDVMPRISTVAVELPSTREINWHYKAADYYDEGISYLRIYLHRCSGGSPSVGHTAFANLVDASSTPPITESEPPNKKRRRSVTVPSPDNEALLSAIAVFSLYESMNGNMTEWKQYVFITLLTPLGVTD
jgi:hypothetical protein